MEEAWRRLKSELRMRPVYPWAVQRIHAQVALTALALLLERVAEQTCSGTWRSIRDDVKQISGLCTRLAYFTTAQILLGGIRVAGPITTIDSVSFRGFRGQKRA